MGRSSSQKLPGNIARVITSLCTLVLLAVFCMVIPLWTALAVGLASVSLVVFGLSTLLLIGLLFINNHSLRLRISIALAASLFGLAVPQISFIHTASRAHVSLVFDPLSYLSFSGETKLSADRLLAYKQVGNQPLQIAFYRSPAKGPRPTVVLLHGGAWRYGSHLEAGDWPRFLTSNGFHVASVEYRLANDTYHTWKDAPSDVHDALRYLSEQQTELNIDGSRLHLLGQSAGGHLALLEAYRFNTVHSVISLYAPIDPSLDYETSRDKSAELDFIGGPPAQYPQRYKALSPLTYVSNASPRTLIFQGKRDDLVTPRNALILSDKLRSVGVAHELILLPLSGHSFENQRGGFATQIAEQRVLHFLK